MQPPDPTTGLHTFSLDLNKQRNQGGPTVQTDIGQLPFAKWWHICATLEEKYLKDKQGFESSLALWVNGELVATGEKKMGVIAHSIVLRYFFFDSTYLFV